MQTKNGTADLRITYPNVGLFFKGALAIVEACKNLPKGPQSVSKRKLLPEVQKKANSIRHNCKSMTRSAIVNQIAGEVHVSESTIWNWIKKGDLLIPAERL